MSPDTLAPMDRRFLALVAALSVLGLITVSCGESGGDGPDSASTTPQPSPGSFSTSLEDVDVYPVFISSEVVVGTNRFLVGLLDRNDAPVGTPDMKVAVSFFDLEQSDEDPVAREEMDFIWSVPGKRGVYVTDAEFDRPGTWGAEVSVRGGGFDESVRGTFEVAAEGLTPAIGAPAPASDNPTADEVEDLAEISTDPHPDTSFYQSTVADALDAGTPFVVTFATPKFCTSAVCGPTLEIVKSVAEDFPRDEFIHVEVYTNLDDPADLQVVPAVEEWKLPTEPWVFVVDSDGKVAAKFEGVVGASELRRALRAL